MRATGQVQAEPVLRWSMLLHDCGKPACKTVDENGVGHFYGHPKASREIAERILRRLRFSGEDSERILLLVEMCIRDSSIHQYRSVLLTLVPISAKLVLR